MANPYFSLLKVAWRYARHQRKLYVFVYALFIFANGIVALNPLLYGWFINGMQKDGLSHLQYAWIFAGAYFGLRLVEWSFHGPGRVLERKLAFNIARNFLQELYHQTLHLSLKWHQDHHSGATINRIRKAYEALQGFFQNGFMYIYIFSKFCFSFIAMVIFSPLYGSIGFVIGIVTVWVIFKFDKPFIKAVDETNEKEHIVSSALFDSLSNIITVITLRLENQMEGSLFRKVSEVLKPFMKTIRINEVKWFFAEMLISLIYVITVLGYVHQNWEPGKVFMLGNLVALLGFVTQFTSVFKDIASHYTQIVQFDTDMKTTRFISEAYQAQRLPDKVTGLSEGWSSIAIENLNFSHKGSYQLHHKAQSLHNISIMIQKKKRIALIGESGSGKSTLLALLRGLYSPHPGTVVSVDNAMRAPLSSLANCVTLFPQEPEIFESTIEHNITLGLPFNEKQIIDVCNIAHFTEVAELLPNGLKSYIQEKGANLSGGQKQRLALARGILAAKNSDIILFDEPTSSIDPKTEILIYQKLFEEYKDKAVVSSLHRLYLLKYFHYIYILQNGMIVDEGTLDDLKGRSLFFQEIWRHEQEKVTMAE